MELDSRKNEARADMKKQDIQIEVHDPSAISLDDEYQPSVLYRNF